MFGRHAIYIHHTEPLTDPKWKEVADGLNPRYEYYYTPDCQRRMRLTWDGRGDAPAYPLQGPWPPAAPWPGTPEWEDYKS